MKGILQIPLILAWKDQAGGGNNRSANIKAGRLLACMQWAACVLSACSAPLAHRARQLKRGRTLLVGTINGNIKNS